jgi:ribonuclease BN (tRNA processing enzyme)
VAADGELPALILDAGTGLQQLTPLLAGQPFRGTILLGHLHWDHTHGMPFFRGGTGPGHRVRVLLPEQGVDAAALLARVISPPHFPINPHQLGEGWEFGSIDEGRHDIEGFTVLALEIPHKGGRTFGFRVSDGRTSIAYLSDHSPLALGHGPEGLGAYHSAAMALAEGVDLLVHDAQHTADELPAKAYLGHSAVDYAVGLGIKAGAKRVALFHHDPWRTDASIDGFVASFSDAPVEVIGAYDGRVVELP